MADTEVEPVVAPPSAPTTEQSTKGAEAVTEDVAGSENAPAAEAAATTTTEAAETAKDPKEASAGVNGAEEKDPKDESKETKEEESKEKDENRERHGQPSRRGRPFSNHDRPRQDFSKNIKSDYSCLPETDNPALIRKQVEFYFSDSNLASDNFLFQKVDGANNLPVPISVIHSFKRMQRFQPFSAVVAALKESATLNLVEDDTAVQRKVPLAPDLQQKSHVEIKKVFEDEAMARSVYVKGFGEEQPTTQFDIEAFFTPYGSTNQVRLRRDYQRRFKGSAFVEFDSEETQKKFLALDPQPRFNDKALVIKSKKQYCDEKVEDIKAGRVRASDADAEPKSRGGRDGGREDGRDWRDRRDEDRKNGFRDDRRGGRGGRGRGRGFRDSRGRGGRDRNDRNEERGQRNSRDKNNGDGDSKTEPATTTTTTETEGNAKAKESPASETAAPVSAEKSVPAAPEEGSKKRARGEDDEGAREQASEGAANKRARDEDATAA